MYVHTYIVTFADTYMSGYCLLLPLSTAKLNLKLLNKIQPSEQPENKYQHGMAQLSTQKHHLGESVCTGARLRAVNVDRVLNRMKMLWSQACTGLPGDTYQGYEGMCCSGCT